MRTIEILYSTLRYSYHEISTDIFQSITGDINRIFQESASLLRDVDANVVEQEQEQQQEQEQEQEQEPVVFTRSIRSLVMAVSSDTESDTEPDIDERNITFRTPTTASQSQPEHPPPLERNTTTTTIADLSREYRTLEPEDILPQPDNHENTESDRYTSEEYQEYIQFKKKPRLTTKCFSIKDGREKLTECSICFEEHSLRNTLTFGCGHEFCNTCACDHFHFSVTNQPYKRHYTCPTCRVDVKRVRVNYSKLDAKNKQELLDNDELTYNIKVYCIAETHLV
jgi:hypothetical protein